jgi:hypothetical protein
MATELEIRARLDTMLSLPMRLERLASSIGTTIWPGQPMRLDLPSGMELTAQDRAEIQARLDQVNEIITGSNLTTAESGKGRLSLLTKMLLAKAVSGSLSIEAAAARREMYDETLADIPPWAIDAAIKRWNRGEVPDLGMGALNFAFAPDSAVLRALCKLELGPFESQAVKLRRLLQTIPIARAMDPTPVPAPEIKSAGGKVVSIGGRKI